MRLVWSQQEHLELNPNLVLWVTISRRNGCINGIEAAKLSKLGFVSREDGIECDQGFFKLMVG